MTWRRNNSGSSGSVTMGYDRVRPAGQRLGGSGLDANEAE